MLEVIRGHFEASELSLRRMVIQWRGKGGRDRGNVVLLIVEFLKGLGVTEIVETYEDLVNL